MLFFYSLPGSWSRQEYKWRPGPQPAPSPPMHAASLTWGGLEYRCVNTPSAGPLVMPQLRCADVGTVSPRKMGQETGTGRAQEVAASR